MSKTNISEEPTMIDLSLKNYDDGSSAVFKSNIMLNEGHNKTEQDGKQE